MPHMRQAERILAAGGRNRRTDGCRIVRNERHRIDGRSGLRGVRCERAGQPRARREAAGADRASRAGRLRCSTRAARRSAARCSCATASTGCSTRARRFSRSAQLAGHGLYDDGSPPAASSPASAASAGIECMIVANDATVKGGTYYPITVKKHLRAQEIALENRAAVHLSRRFRRRLPAASRTRCFPTASTSAASSTTRRRCPARASRRSPS